MALLSMTLAIAAVAYVVIQEKNRGTPVSVASNTPGPQATPTPDSQPATSPGAEATPSRTPRIAHNTPAPIETPSATPSLPIIPALMGTGGGTTATVAETPSAPPTPSDVVDLRALAATPAEWPKTVTLKQAGVVFPVIFNGQVAGEIQSTPGMQVTLVKVTPDQLTVSFQGGMQNVPVSATDLIERVKASRRH